MNTRILRRSRVSPTRIAVALAALAACLPVAKAQTVAQAQTAASANNAAPIVADASALQTIEIKGQNLRSAGTPYSSTVLDSQQIRDAAVSQPEQLLKSVPGVEVRGYQLGGVVSVITIRGFSGGAHGGDLGMVIDGIPLNEAMSHSDGYADLNVIVPLEIERYEVFRGPVSALYGNFNRGGLIAIESRRGGEYVEADLSLASHGTVDLQAALGTKLGPGQFNGAVQGFRTGDYRPDSEFKRGTASARYSLDLAPQTKLSFSGRLHKGDWTSASYLLKSQFDGGDPYGKDPRVRDDGGEKNFGTARVDLAQGLSEQIKLLVFAYGTRQDYVRYFTRPFNATTWSQREENYDRSVGGAGFSLNGNTPLAGVPLEWVAGVEAYREDTDYQFFEGLQARARTAPAAYDRTYAFNSTSAFTEVTATPTPWFRPTLGLRYDRFTGDCTRNGAETGSDPCDKLNTASRTTPKLGVRSTVAPGLDLRASAAEGFALPPNVAKYASGGANLEPTVFTQYEIGVSYASKLLRADLAGYRLTSSNEVRTVSPGVYENFGRTERRGVELSLMLRPIDDVEVGLVANRTDTEVKENVVAALVGKQVTGVPKWSAGLTAAFRPAAGFGASAELRHVADSAVNATNTVFYGAFTTLDLGLQYSGTWSGASAAAGRYRLYAKLDNATDRVYATNAFVIGGQDLVAPAPPRSFQIGLQTTF